MRARHHRPAKRHRQPLTDPSPPPATSLRFLFANCRSLKSAATILALQAELLSGTSDLLLLCETWLSPEIPDQLILGDASSSFSMYRFDRDLLGGGAAIIVRSSLLPVPVPLKASNKTETVAVDITSASGKCRLLCFYRPPSGSRAEQAAYLSSLIAVLREASESTNIPILIAGDANFPEIVWSQPASAKSRLSSSFLAASNELGLFQHVDSPTRISNVLDLVFTRPLSLLSSPPLILPSTLASDHADIRGSLSLFRPADPMIPSPRRLFRKANWPAFRVFMSGIDWNYISDIAPTPTEFCAHFLSVLDDGCSRFVPLSRPHPPSRLPHSLMMLRRALFRARRARHPKRARLARRYRRGLRSFFHRQEAAILERPRGLYDLLRARRGKRAPPPPLLLNGAQVPPGDETAQAFASHFSASYRPPPPAFPIPPPVLPAPAALLRVWSTPATVEKTIRALKPKLSAGLDGLPPILYKELSASVAVPLALLFRKALESEAPPDQFLPSIVTPVFKRKGPKHSPENYRPVGQIDAVTKIFASLCNRQLLGHLEHNRLISNAQYGFRARRSRESQMVDYLDFIARCKAVGQTPYTVLVDFRRAFDSPFHPCLLSRLASVGVSGPLLALLANFLPRRTAQVRVGGKLSQPYPLLSGTVQGSPLSCTLFILFIDPLISEILSTGSNAFCYADDLKIVDTDLSRLQLSLDKLDEFCRTWGMQLAPEKCEILPFGPPPVPIPTLMGFPLRITEPCGVKDLGFFIRPDLDFCSHVDYVVANARRAIGLLFRIVRSSRREPYLLAYTSTIRPLLESGSVVFNMLTAAQCMMLERVQRHFTARLFKRLRLRPRHYVSRAENLGLPTLKSRRIIADLLFVHAHYSGRLYCSTLDAAAVEPVRDSGRRHRLAFAARPHNALARSIVQRSAPFWNALPDRIVSLKRPAFRDHLESRLLSFRL